MYYVWIFEISVGGGQVMVGGFVYVFGVGFGGGYWLTNGWRRKIGGVGRMESCWSGII